MSAAPQNWPASSRGTAKNPANAREAVDLSTPARREIASLVKAEGLELLELNRWGNRWLVAVKELDGSTTHFDIYSARWAASDIGERR